MISSPISSEVSSSREMPLSLIEWYHVVFLPQMRRESGEVVLMFNEQESWFDETDALETHSFIKHQGDVHEMNTSHALGHVIDALIKRECGCDNHASFTGKAEFLMVDDELTVGIEVSLHHYGNVEETYSYLDIKERCLDALFAQGKKGIKHSVDGLMAINKLEVGFDLLVEVMKATGHERFSMAFQGQGDTGMVEGFSNKCYCDVGAFFSYARPAVYLEENDLLTVNVFTDLSIEQMLSCVSDDILASIGTMWCDGEGGNGDIVFSLNDEKINVHVTMNIRTLDEKSYCFGEQEWESCIQSQKDNER